MQTLTNAALDKVNLGTIIIDQDLRIIIWNNWLVRWTGHAAEEMIGNSLIDVYPQFATKTYLEILNNALFYGQSRFCSSALHKIFIPPAEDVQNIVRQNMLVEPLWNGDNKYALIQITDMTGYYVRVKQLENGIKEIGMEYEQAKASEVISRYQALHDSLTGLPNRNLFYDRMEHLIQISERNGEMFAVMFLDLDGFKIINDRFGHEAGDMILQTLAIRIKHLIRNSDTMARLGGDEFLLLFPNINDKTDLIPIAQKIKNDFDQPYCIMDNNINLSASIGISLYPEDGRDPRTLIKNADKAMYKIKNKEKNNFSFFNAD